MARFHIFLARGDGDERDLVVPLAIGLLSGFRTPVLRSILSRRWPTSAASSAIRAFGCWIKACGWPNRRRAAIFGSPDRAIWWLAVLYGGLAVALCFPKIRPPHAGDWASWPVGSPWASWSRWRTAIPGSCNARSCPWGTARRPSWNSLPAKTLLYDAGQMGAPRARGEEHRRILVVAGNHASRRRRAFPCRYRSL